MQFKINGRRVCGKYCEVEIAIINNRYKVATSPDELFSSPDAAIARAMVEVKRLDAAIQPLVDAASSAGLPLVHNF